MTDQPATSHVPRIFTATLVMGVSGSGKTSLLETFAVYLWETYQSILLLYSWDGGAIPTAIQKRMKQGLIRFWRVRTRSAPGLGLEGLYFATKGYWPKTINPETGETAPAVQLVAPITTKYHVSCPKGHPMMVVPVVSLIVPTFCNECKGLIDRSAFLVREEAHRTKGFDVVGGVAFDGLTSMANLVLDHMDTDRGAGRIGGEKSSFGGVVQSGSVSFGGNNRADVGFAQTRAQQFVNNSLGIPFLKEGPVFTALSTEGTDKGGLSIIGADLPGQAALTQVPQWFGNICETDHRHMDDAGKQHFALHIRPFTDKHGRQHLLKTSASPTGPVPDILIDPPIDDKHPFVNFNLGKMFQLLDQDLAQALGASVEPMTPLLADYGDAVTVETPTPTPTPGIATPPPPTPAASPTPVAPAPPAAAAAVVVKKRRGVPAVETAAPVEAASPTPAPPVGAPPPPPGARPPMRAPGT